MRKFKYALFVIFAFVICVFCFAACSGEQQPPAASGSQSGTTSVEPGSPSVPQKPDENNNGNNETEQPNNDPDEGSEKEEPKQPEEETPDKPTVPPTSEKPDEPTEPVIPEKPVEPVNPVDPVDPVDPVIPDDPTEPEEPTITELEEGIMTDVEKADAEFSFIAKTSAYYVVKVEEQSAVGALRVGEELVAINGENGFYLHGVYLEKDEELKLSVAVSGGEIGIFGAERIYTSTDEGYSAVSDETQKYFVYVAEYDGVCNILLQYEGDELSIGTCYIGGSIFYDENQENFDATKECTLNCGDVVVIWVEKADVVISIEA